ncbi:hypothetical protein IGI53_000254 [Enterococcus sp. DIV0788_1]
MHKLLILSKCIYLKNLMIILQYLNDEKRLQVKHIALV